jgi:hypothetical protein
MIGNMHHCGRVLLAKLVAGADVARKATFAGMEDTSGGFEILHLHTVCRNNKDDHVWPKAGSWFAIKEPFLTLQVETGTQCVQIDHPSDLTYADSWPPNVFTKFGVHNSLTDTESRNPLECKEAGNSNLSRKNLAAAHASYTVGFQLIAGASESSDQCVKQDLHCSRSLVRLNLGRYEGAMEDAIASLTHISDEKHKKLDGKAYFRAASASYHLKLYEKAALFLCDELALIPEHQDALRLFCKTQDRLREQARGSYDILSIRSGLSQQPQVDAADFVINTAIKPSGLNRGRGLFATRDLEPGDLIMAETPFCTAWGHESKNLMAFEADARSPDETPSGLVGLWRSAVNEAAKNPSKGSDLLRLHSTYKGTDTYISQCDGVAAVDIFQVHDIVTCHAFELTPWLTAAGVDDPNVVTRGSSGIWIRLSYINHSCIPNSQKIMRGDLVLVHATKPIAEGEEITLGHIGDRMDFAHRTDQTKFTWCFQYDCALCKADAEYPPVHLTERVYQWRENYFTGMPQATLELMEQFVAKIGRTYDPALHAGLPKGALLSPLSVLLQLHLKAKDYAKGCQVTVRLLRALAWQVDTQDEAIRSITPTMHSIFPEGAMGRFALELLLESLADQAVRAHISGATTVAKHLLDFARLVEGLGRNTDTEAMLRFKRRMSNLAGNSLSTTAMEQEMAKMGA